MDRSQEEDPQTKAHRWFPEMGPLAGSVGSIAAHRVDGRDAPHDVVFVDRTKRITLTHGGGATDQTWTVRDNLTKVQVDLHLISQARSVVDGINKMIALTTGAAARGGEPERVVLDPTPEGPTAGMFIATIEYSDGSATPLGLFASMDREIISKAMKLCGLFEDVPAQIGGGR